MKKIYSLFIAAAALFTSACTSDLDLKPEIGNTPETVYKDLAGYQSVIAKVYSAYSIVGAERGGGSADISSNKGEDMIRTLFYLQELPTDEAAYKYCSGDNLTDISYMSWNADDVWVSDAYYRLYYIISLANEFLRNSNDGNIAHFDQATQDEIKTYAAEARFMRALSYYYVLDLFGKGAFVDENTPMTAFIPEAYDATKLYNYILSEVDAIAPVLPEKANYARAGRGAALALGARLALNGERFTGVSDATKAIDYCKQVIALGYSLEPNYTHLFDGENHTCTSEVIFAFAIDHQDAASWGSATFTVSASSPVDKAIAFDKYGIDNGWGSFTVRGELTSLFDAADGRNLFITDGQSQYFTAGLDAADNGYWSYKWTNKKHDGSQACATDYGVDTDYPMFRLSEIYLTAAEAVLRGGSGMSRAEALDLVNRVRNRAFGGDTGHITDAQFNLQFILDERGRELYHELHRRSDLVRFDRFTTSAYIWQWKGGVLDGREVNKRYNYYPIPLTELSANPNLKNELY